MLPLLFYTEEVGPMKKKKERIQKYVFILAVFANAMYSMSSM